MYARELVADGAAFTPEQIAAALDSAWRRVREAAGPDRYGGVRGEPEFWRGFLDGVRRSLDGRGVSAEVFGRLAAHFRRPDSWTVFADVSPALAALAAAGLRLAVVSNWDSHLPALLTALDLAPRFETVLVSAVEEIGKPDPEIFRRACARLAVAPGEALHVGDSIAEDYEAAKAAGLAALLLDRTGRHPEHPDRIESLDELPGRLRL